MYLDIEGINNTSPASSMTLLTPEANRPQLKDKPHSYGWCGMTNVDIEISKETQSQLQFLRSLEPLFLRLQTPLPRPYVPNQVGD